VTSVFAGVDGRADAQLPTWYDHETEPTTAEPGSFAEAIRALPRAVETSVAYTELPKWYRQRHRSDDAMTFAEVIRDVSQSLGGSRVYTTLRGTRGGR
jgi:hypothetical protein